MFRKIAFAVTQGRVVREAVAGVAAFAMILFSLSGTAANSQNRAGEGDSAAPSAIFTNNTAITIPSSGPGTPYPSPITVAGLPTSLPTTPGAIKVTINGFSHTFPDDVGFVLVGPTGAALNIQDGAGDGTDIANVTYTISDDGATVLPDTGAWATGTYKPGAYYIDNYPAPGPGTTYQNPGPISGGTATFASTFGGTNPNGTWNLYVADFVGGDTGTLAGGWSIEIAGSVAVTQHVVDFDGNNRTDFAVVRVTGGEMTWIYTLNGPVGTTLAYRWGLASDRLVPEDYDGDGKTDIAVWRPGSATVAAFYILQSQTSTLRHEAFGQTGDDPSVVGDYNNDGKADLAVYRRGATAGSQSTWFYRTVANGPVTFVPWGLAEDFPAPGDYDNDGRNDFVVQRFVNSASANFWRRLATGVVDVVPFGFPTDFIVPGDYDGDSKTDIAVSRSAAGSINWYWVPSGGGAVQHVIFGSTGDVRAPGDYDGDGKTDPAIWRSTGTSTFWYRGSTSGVGAVPFGQSTDTPVASYNVH